MPLTLCFLHQPDVPQGLVPPLLLEAPKRAVKLCVTFLGNSVVLERPRRQARSLQKRPDELSLLLELVSATIERLSGLLVPL